MAGAKQFLTFSQQVEYLKSEKEIAVSDDQFAEEILQRIDYWYQMAKGRGTDWTELQWRLNQILEQENEHELD